MAHCSFKVALVRATVKLCINASCYWAGSMRETRRCFGYTGWERLWSFCPQERYVAPMGWIWREGRS